MHKSPRHRRERIGLCLSDNLKVSKFQRIKNCLYRFFCIMSLHRLTDAWLCHKQSIFWVLFYGVSILRCKGSTFLVNTQQQRAKCKKYLLIL